VRSTVFPLVERSAASVVGRVDIKLPNASFIGEIVDEEGNRATNAIVYADSEETAKEPFSESVPDGLFTLSGLPEGRFRVHAQGPLQGKLAESDVTVVTLSEDEVSPPVKLVLRPHSVIRGRVTDALGVGVFGAILQPLPHTAGVGEPAAHTDPTGSFAIQVPKNVQAIRLAVYAPGHALRLVSYPLSVPGPLEIPLSPASGRLELKTPHLVKGKNAILLHGDCAAFPLIARSVGMKVTFTQGKRDSIVLPEMEPGAYTLCMVGFIASTAGGAGDDCRSGVLAAGGELTLSVDLPEK